MGKVSELRLSGNKLRESFERGLLKVFIGDLREGGISEGKGRGPGRQERRRGRVIKCGLQGECEGQEITNGQGPHGTRLCRPW